MSYQTAGLGASASARKFWRKQAQACKGFADEGECLAMVAKHGYPVTITLGNSGDGLGVDTTASDVRSAVDVIAGLIANPDATLRARGPALVQAADQYVINPMISKVGEALAPYAYKYVLPPMAVLYVLSGIAAYYSYKAAKQTRGRVTANRRRRRRTSR